MTFSTITSQVKQWDEEKINPDEVALRLMRSSNQLGDGDIGHDLFIAAEHFAGQNPTIPKYYHYTNLNAFTSIVSDRMPNIRSQSPVKSGSGQAGAWVSAPLPIKTQAGVILALSSINFNATCDKVSKGTSNFPQDGGCYIGHQLNIKLEGKCAFVGVREDIIECVRGVWGGAYAVIRIEALYVVAKTIYDMSTVAVRMGR